jgi:hypothetical protein
VRLFEGGFASGMGLPGGASIFADGAWAVGLALSCVLQRTRGVVGLWCFLARFLFWCPLGIKNLAVSWWGSFFCGFVVGLRRSLLGYVGFRVMWVCGGLRGGCFGWAVVDVSGGCLVVAWLWIWAGCGWTRVVWIEGGLGGAVFNGLHGVDPSLDVSPSLSGRRGRAVLRCRVGHA